MNVILTFEEMGITPEFSDADIINRGCDMVMQLMFPEFEDIDVINMRIIVLAREYERIVIPIKLKIESEF
jgi:hypothetical protein